MAPRRVRSVFYAVRPLNPFTRHAAVSCKTQNQLVTDTARRMLLRYGGSAPQEAAQRTSELALAGETASSRFWAEVATVLRGLLARPGGDLPH